MKLIKLKVRGLATFDEAEVDFSEASYPLFVSGHTGAGKTTFFVDAVTAALYGKTYGENVIKDFIMAGRSAGYVELEFEVDGHRYLVQRTIYRSRSSEATLSKWSAEADQWRILSTNASEVGRQVEKLVGFNYDILLRSAVVRQGEVKRFLDMQPYERRDLLLDIFKLRFEAHKQRADEKARGLQADIMELKGRISVVEERVKEEGALRKEVEEGEPRLIQLANEVRELEESLGRVQGDLGRLREDKAILEERLRQLGELGSKLNDRKEELRELEGRISAIEREVGCFSHLFKDLSAHQGKLVQYLGLERRRAELESQVGDSERLLEAIANRSELAKELEKLAAAEAEVELLRQMRERLLEDEKSYEERLKQAREALSALSRADAECPVCGSPLTEDGKGRRRASLLQVIEDCEKGRAEKRSEISSLKERMDDLEGRIKYLLTLKGRYEQLEREIANRQVSSESLSKLRDDLRQTSIHLSQLRDEIFKSTGAESIDQAQQILSKASLAQGRAHELSLLKSRSQDLQREILDLEEKLKQKPGLEEQLRSLQRKFEELDESRLKLEAALQRKRDEKSKLEALLQNAKSRLNEILRLKEELKQLKAKVQEYELDYEAYLLLSKVFSESGMPAALLGEYLREVERFANDYLSTFAKNISLSMDLGERGGRQSVELSLRADGFDRKIYTFSGGEQTIIGFAIRLAVGRLLAQLYSPTRRPRFLIIDEGFGPLDEGLRSEVAEALASLKAHGEYEQIIVISHQEDLKGSQVFKSIAEVRKDAHGVSRLSLSQAT